MKTSVVALLIALASAASVVRAAEKPNVLFVLIDDFGWYDVGYNGSTFYETPEMDRLSKQWTRFDHCYTPSPMCSPTRVSILTAKNPARHGVTQWLPGVDVAYRRKGEKARVYCPKPQAAGIKDKEVTLGEAFQEAGYETAFFGKWHMGKLNETGGPTRHGFDSEKAIIETNNCQMFHPFHNSRKAKPPTYFPDSNPGDNFTDLLTNAAIEFVTAERDQPFYLHLCHFAMHAPIASKSDVRDRFEKKAQALPALEPDRVLDDHGHKAQKLRQDSAEYAGELFTLDKNIGRLVGALKSAGLYDNTIIVLTGDNGGRSSYFRTHPTSNQPLRTGKTFVFEGGVRTPLLIHWPGHSKPGSSVDSPLTSMDFYPTLLEMAMLPARPDQHVDGVSLVPLFGGGSLQRDAMYFHFPHYQGEGSYPASAIRQGNYKLIHNYHHDDVLLFDVVKDPNETTNLAPMMSDMADHLDAKLMNYLAEVKAYIPKPPLP